MVYILLRGLRSMPRLPAAVLALMVAAALVADVTCAAPPAASDANVSTAAPGPLPSADKWSYAYSAYGEPKYPRGFSAFRLRQSRRAEGRHALSAAIPTGARASTSSTRTRSRGSARGRGHPDVRDAHGALGRRARTRCTACSPRRCWCPPDKSSITFRINPKARFYNGDPVTAAGRQAPFRHADEQGGIAAVRDALAGVASATVLDERTIRFDLTDRTDRHDLQGRWPAGVLAQVGAGADGKPKPFDQIVNEYPITSGPYTIGAADPGGASTSSATRTTGRATSACARPVQLRSHRLPLLPGQRDRDGGVQGRRVRLPAWSTRRRRWVRAARRAEVGRRPHRQADVSRTASARACSRTSSTCAGRSSRTSACARRSTYATTSRRSTSTRSTSAPTACSPTRSSRRRAALGRASSRCSSRFARSCRRRCSAPP